MKIDTIVLASLFVATCFGQSSLEQLQKEIQSVETQAPSAAIKKSGPFGLDRGMTKDQIIALVGQGALKEVVEDILVLTSAPKSHMDFEEYRLVISPGVGLVKITAVGRTIRTSGFGEGIRSAFRDTTDALRVNYGTPESAYDFVRSASLWKEPQYWMMGLAKQERNLAAYWKFNSGTNQLSAIMLRAAAFSSDTGYLVLDYEFEGFENYNAAKKSKAGSVF